MKIRLLIAGIVVAVLLGGLGVFHFVVKPAMIEQFVASNPQPPASVAAEEARTERWMPEITSIGTLVAIRGVEVSSQIGGIVSAIQFESGDVVQKDAQLVKLDDQVEQADLKDNKATLREAIHEFERQKSLQGRGFAAEARLEEARAARDSASAATQRTRALIEQKTIEAPFAGRLGLRHVELGQYVSPGMALVTLQALDPMRVDFPVPEQEVSRIEPGQKIEVAVDAYADETFTGTVETTDAQVDQETRTLTVRGNVGNPENKLLPGMFAEVRVLAGEERELVTVPRTAVTYSLYGDSIYVVTEGENSGGAQAQEDGGAQAQEDGGEQEERVLTAERRFVRVGETRGDRVAIREGVEVGETVVTTGQLKLQPGARVQINNEAPLTPQPERPRP